jgi:hypothetical protein
MKKIKIDRERFLDICNRYSVPLQALGSLVLYFLIEVMSRHSFVKAWEYMTERPVIFLYNGLLIFMTTTVVYLFRRRFLARLLVFFFWFLLGMVNGILLTTRITPFTGPDILMASDAVKLMNDYLSPVVPVLIVIALILVAAGLVWFWFKGPKYHGKRNWIADLSVIGGSVAAFILATSLGLGSRLLSSYFGNIAFAYQDYGFAYCFSVTLFETGIDQPNGYSEELIASIEESEGTPEADGSGEKPNLVFLQLESFFDPTTVNYLHFSEDPIPCFRRLQTEYSSGYLRVPSVGAGTANTEFEAITGMSMRYFGPGEYPYKTVLQEETCESIPYDLKELGYATHAVHNHEASFYSRNTVYSMLGFDSFTSKEYMPDVSDTTPTGWVKDSVLTEEILKCLDSTEGPDYVYTVSVQGHGDYSNEPVLTDPEIRVTGAENRECNNYAWEYYVNQIHEMDGFIQDLTEALEDYPEPVVLVMYGDHLPTLGLENRDLSNRYLFQTPYVIWDNLGLEKTDVNMTSYQIGAAVLDRVGIHDGTIVRYHQARRQTRDYQTDLEVLQYDMLYGEKYVYGGENPFQQTDLQMGILPIEAESVEKVSEDTWRVSGKNFTEASQISINGELTDTVFLNTSALLMQNVELEDGDQVSVAQVCDSTAAPVLSETEAVTYRADE